MDFPLFDLDARQSSQPEKFRRPDIADCSKQFHNALPKSIGLASTDV
jgi:hypothetical protein